jgi:NAD(P)-dependent dehydrogenase (short-subunit alcohol dehydrogenase family)
MAVGLRASGFFFWRTVNSCERHCLLNKRRHPRLVPQKSREPTGFPGIVVEPNRYRAEGPRMLFAGKVALVTGAGSGIGKATALALARYGASVGVLSRNADEVAAVATEIRRQGGAALALPADAADEASMRAAVEQLASAFGGLHIVVANAGVNGAWAPIDDLAPAEWDETIAINLRGTYLTLHFTVPLLKQAGEGAIVVVSSINGTRTFTTPGATAYAATKAAQVAMVQQLALELGKARIRINAVCPGAIETDIDDNTEQRGAEEAGIPVVWPEGDIPVSQGKPGTADEVADAILFLASSKARHITGIPLWIDGGQGLLR